MGALIKSKLMIIFGSIVAIVGPYLLFTAIVPYEETIDHTIPAGMVFSISYGGLAWGSYSGEYSQSSGGSIEFYVFTESQYEDYLDGISTTSLHYAIGSSHSFSVSLPGYGRFFMAFVPVNYNSDCLITVSYRVSGITVPVLALGAVLLAGGIATVFLGTRRMRAKEASKPFAGPTDVVIFKKPPP
jgi:hypothetical protein